MTHPFVYQFSDIMKDETIRAVDKMVVAVLWFRKGCNEECWPSIPRLVKDVGADRKTIMAAIKRLDASGRVKVHRENGKENHYELITSVGNGTSPQTGTTNLGTSPETDTCQKRDLTSAGNGTLKEVQEKKKENSSPTPPAEGKATRVKLPLVKKKDELQKILDAYDIEPLRKEFEPQGLDVDKWWASTQDYVLNGSAEKPYPNPAKWRDWDKAFKNSAKGAIERGLFINKNENRSNPVGSEPTHPLWPEIKAFLKTDLARWQELRAEARPYARKKSQCGEFREPPESLIAEYMCKIYEAEKARAP